jgi:broad specificity phosphatase PhoE
VSVIVDDRLREVCRPWTGSQFESAVASYMKGERNEGWEPIREVVSRLQDSLVSHTGAGPVGMVTHGTAMALLLDSLYLVDSAQFCSELTMPDAWTFDGKNILRLYLTDS